MAASFTVAGQRVDYGSHRLHPAAGHDTLTLVGELLGADLQVRPRNGRIRLGGRWLRFPFGPTDLLRGLAPAVAARAGAEAMLGPLRSRHRGRAGGPPASFATELARRLGPTVTDLFYVPYARKLWGLDADHLDAELARRRVPARSALAVARAALTPGPRTFLYPRHGYGQIVEALAQAARAAGATIQLATPAGPLGELADDLVVWTAPIPALLRAAGPAVPAAVTSAAGRMQMRGMAFVYLPVDRSQWTPFDAHYFPGLDTVVSRVSEPKNYRDGPDPSDRTVVCAEVPCTASDDVWSLPDAALAARVAAELEAQELPPVGAAAVATAEGRRLADVYPVYRLGFRADAEVVDRWVATLPRVLVTGRQGLFVPDNLHHVLAMGRDAAAAVMADGTVDRAAWTAALVRFASHVVED
jgi:protoporphyrinogen oxidase